MSDEDQKQVAESENGLSQQIDKPDENKLKELHLNVRHITQLGMSWFAFFVTVNYLTMGWLAKDPKDKIDPFIIRIVAKVFIVQDSLGICGLACVLIAAMAMKIQIDIGESPSKVETIPAMTPKNFFKIFCSIKKANSESVPALLYTLIGVFLMSVLSSLVYAWAHILRYYPFK